MARIVERQNLPIRGRVEELEEGCKVLVKERDEALAKVTTHGDFMGALLFIARARFEPDTDPFMVLLRKTARDALDGAGIVWNDVDNSGFAMTTAEAATTIPNLDEVRRMASAGEPLIDLNRLDTTLRDAAGNPVQVNNEGTGGEDAAKQPAMTKAERKAARKAELDAEKK